MFNIMYRKMNVMCLVGFEQTPAVFQRLLSGLLSNMLVELII